MTENILEPRTAREMALCNHIQELERRLYRYEIPRESPGCPVGDEPPSVMIARGHPELLRMANLRATVSPTGGFEIKAVAKSIDHLSHYEYSEYVPREHLGRFSPTGALESMYLMFLRRLAHDLKPKSAEEERP